MADLTNIFGGPFRPTPTRKKAPDIQLMNAMLKADLDPPEHLYLDGKIYRFGPKNSCWYVAFGDGVPAGRFGDWKLGLDVTWRAEVDRDLTDIDRMALSQRLTESRKLRDEEKAKRQQVASFAVDQIWAECIEASRDHPYLMAKGIEAHGTKVTGDGRIVVPIYDQFGDVASLQYITGEGEKKFHPGAKTGGCFWALGKPTRTIYICEGFATAATVYEATKTFTYVAFNAANIPSTVQFARSNHKGKIVIIADNDESGTGQRYAEEAAKKYGAPVSSAILVAGAAPVKVSKADEKLKYAERAFQNMFALGGQILVSGMPIVKYSAAETWFLQDGKTESTAKSYATNKVKRGVLNLLQDSKLVEKKIYRAVGSQLLRP